MRWRIPRHLLAIIVLPFTVTVIVPLWLLQFMEKGPRFPLTAGEWILAAIGLLFFAVGAVLFIACVWLFGSVGKGTLAPWDSPRQLVVKGPYAYVRNPMISGVIFILFGEGMILRSLSIIEWAAIFAVANAIYIPLLEEPVLRIRFKDEYLEYKTNVPRFLPRKKPYRPSAGKT